MICVVRLSRPLALWLSLSIAAAAVAVQPAAAESLLDTGRKPATSDRAVRSALAEDVGERLNKEFAALAAAKSPREATGPERRILAAFNRSGSDTVDLLMGWANKAIVDKKFPEALDLLDQVVILQPRFAEVYNRRATVHYALDDYRRSLADIRAALALEPRHFGALSGLAAIMREIGESDRAIEIYRRILDVHPTMEAAKTELDKLEASAKGSPI
jgi:tetratricopeptide (TPR) repeat protein